MGVRMKKSHSRLFIGVGILLLLALMYGVQTASSQQEPDGNHGYVSLKLPEIRRGLSESESFEDWSYSNYVEAIEGVFQTFNYFNLSKYGGGWQYEVTRDWTDRAFTYGKISSHDAACSVGLLAAYRLTGNQTYLEYAEDIWEWDRAHFWDPVYGGYYYRLNQDNTIRIGDKGLYEHGWVGLAIVGLYEATGYSSYLTYNEELFDFIENNFYDSTDGSYYGSLSRSLSVLVSDVETNWAAPVARWLTETYRVTGDDKYRNRANELIGNIIDHAYDHQYGWVVNRVSEDWSTFTKTAKGWYDILQMFVDGYRVLGNETYLEYAQRCFDDIQQANSSAGYLMQMNREWTSYVNNELLGEEDPGVAIAHLRIAAELNNDTIAKEAYRYKNAIYTGLHDPVHGGIYRRIYAGGSQSTWKQWIGAGRVMEMLAVFAGQLEPQISASCEIVGELPYQFCWASSAWNGSHVWIFGGQNASGRIPHILRYHPNSSTYRIMAAGFGTGVEATAAICWGQYIYVFGGNDGSWVDTIWKYDIENDTLSSIPTTLPRPMGEIATATNSIYIYLFGGIFSGGRSNEILRFDPTTEALSDTGARMSTGLSAVYPAWGGDAFYIFGGENNVGAAHDYIMRYTPSNNSVVQISTRMPADLAWTNSAWDGMELIYIFGGALDGYHGETPYRTIWRFNTTTEELQEVEGVSLPKDVRLGCVEWCDGEAYYMGGHIFPSTYLADIVRFVPEAPSSDETPPSINHPADIIYEYSSIGHGIIWYASDQHPSTYSVSRNATQVEAGAWSGDPIELSVDGLEVGIYNFTIVVEDSSSNQVSDTVMVYVLASTPPYIDSPEDVVYEAGTTEYFIQWSPSDLTATAYEILRNGTMIDSGEWDNSSIAVDVGGLEPGTYNYTLIVSDVVGNTASDTVLVQSADTTCPTTSSPPDIQYEAGSIGVSLSWTVYDLYPDSYQVLRNGTLIDSGEWDNSSVAVDVGGLEPGTYNYTLVVSDAVGNTASDTVLVLVSDTTTPTMNHPPDRHIEAGTTGISVVWITFDLYPGSFQILNNGSTMRSGCWNMSVLEVPLDGLGIGTHNITLMLLDMSGNLAEDTVMVFVSDVSPPIINHPSDIVYNHTDTGHSITWMPIDLYPSSFKVLCNGTVILDSGWNGSSITVSVDGLELGRYNFTILVKDTSGNSVTDEVWVTVIVHPLMIDPIMAGLVIGGTFAIVIIVLYVRRWR